MIEMVSKKAAEELAVRYQAWCDARNRHSDLGILVWGNMLLESIKETGIFQNRVETIKALMEYSRRRYEKKNS